MRVGGDGWGHNARDGRPEDASRERREAFRRTHRPGDVVRARFLSWDITPASADSNGLAWVQVDGHPLRAPLQGLFAPGDRFLLQVNALEPEILLALVEADTPCAVADDPAEEAEAPRRRLHITI